MAAAPINLVNNGGFETTSLTSSKQFKGTDVTGWTNATTGGYTGYGYNFLVKPGTADTTGFTSLENNVDLLYGPGGGVSSGNYSNNGFTGASPTGGNFLLMDGDSDFRGGVSQAISNLTVGTTYKLTFDWAGASWYTFAGPTTEQFSVSFGNSTQTTNTVSLAAKAFSGWSTATMLFTATAANQTLSFLAIGTPNGLPPTLLLDNVAMAAVPEPASWAMMIMGFGVIGAAMRRRQAALRTA